MSAPLSVIPEGRLPVLAAQINQAHDLACRSAQAAINHAIKVGEGLIEAKTLVEHGEWLPWLAENFDFAETTARNYMRLASHRDEVMSKSATVADLTMREALKHIGRAKPKAAEMPAALSIEAIAPAPEQAEWDRQREEARSGLRDDVEQHVAAKKSPTDSGLSDAQRIAELEEANAFLEGHVAKLEAKIKTYERLELMHRDWTEGGWEQVVKAKEETIAELQRTAQTRIARESHEKVSNLNAMRGLAKKLDKAGKGRDAYIDLDEATNA